ncbi:MAG: aspartate kinase [Deltaproteobacteria bacterium]|nr:aspartate kinase [Deltaproteobacteria bacterium]
MSADPDSRWLVLKFGGTSVATPARWRRVAAAARRALASGHRPILVCSAVAGVTDALTALADAIARGDDSASALARVESPNRRLVAALGVGSLEDIAPRELAALRAAAAAPTLDAPARAELLALGELFSTRIGAAFLATAGFTPRWVDARDLLRAAPPHDGATEADVFLAARAVPDPDDALAAELARGDHDVVITQGFLARDDAGRTVLLGRGGSDTSAATIAARVRAAGLEIWTDVPGLFTVDPRLHDDARLIGALDHREAEVLGALGAKVLHPRCLAPLRAQAIPVRIGWTDRPDVPGTLIASRGAAADPGVKGIATRRGLCLVTVHRDPEWQPVGFMAAVAGVFRQHGLSMDLIASSPATIRVTVDPAAFPSAEDGLDRLLDDLRRLTDHVEAETGLASVSIVGHGAAADAPHFAAAFVDAGVERAHLTCHAGDDTHVTWVVDADAAAPLAAALHDAHLARVALSPGFGPAWRALTTPAASPSPGPSLVPANAATRRGASA